MPYRGCCCCYKRNKKTSLSPLGSLSSIYKVQGSVAHWICQGISFGTDVLGVSFILTSPSLEFFFFLSFGYPCNF